jgi:cytochrome bd-type quinol oxidase subunit 2
MLAVISVLILLTRYRKQIREELSEHLSSKLALTLGIVLAAISFPFILQTDNLAVISASVGAMLAAMIIIVIFFISRKKGRQIR